jgi:hypothetical protein
MVDLINVVLKYLNNQAYCVIEPPYIHPALTCPIIIVIITILLKRVNALGKLCCQSSEWFQDFAPDGVDNADKQECGRGCWRRQCVIFLHGVVYASLLRKGHSKVN